VKVQSLQLGQAWNLGPAFFFVLKYGMSIKQDYMGHLNQLRSKVDDFFDNCFNKNQKEFSCKLGCDQCCHVSLSVSAVEAQAIIDWFDRLNQDMKIILKKLWESEQCKGKDLEENLVSPCAFLYEGKCSIYESRPIICRSHGLPLLRLENGKNFLDCCSLNFQNTTPPKEDMLDLERLNLILSTLNETYFKGQDRVALSSIKEELCQR
jgi:Fe-S-cluster containining protein